MNRLRERLPTLLIMLGVLVALALPLMFLLENFVRDAIVIPLAYVGWIVGVVVDALPQGYILAGLIAVVITVAVRSLPRGRAARWQPDSAPRNPPGRVQIWRERLTLVSDGAYSKERLDHQMGQFVIHVVAYEQRLPVRDTVGGIGRDEIDVPPEIAAYIDLGLHPSVGERQPFLRRVLAWLRLSRGRGVPFDQVRARVEPALTYAEQELRIRPPEAKDDDAADI